MYITLHPVNGLFFSTTWVSRYQKGKASADLYEARDDDGDGYKPNNKTEINFLFQLLSVLIQRYNAILLVTA